MTKLSKTQIALLTHLAEDGVIVEISRTQFMGWMGGGEEVSQILNPKCRFVRFSEKNLNPRVATVRALAKRGMIECVEAVGSSADDYGVYKITDKGREALSN